jgi:hypothetical protein
MAAKGAADAIRQNAALWDGVTEHPHRFGGVEFRRGKRELGHIHGDSLLDIPFPMDVRNELVAKGEVEEHHLLPKSGWVSFYIKREEDVAIAVALLKRSHDIAMEAAKKRRSAKVTE